MRFGASFLVLIQLIMSWRRSGCRLRSVVGRAELVADRAAEPEADTREEGESEHVRAEGQDCAERIDADRSLVAEEGQQAQQRESGAHRERRLDDGDGGQGRLEGIPAFDDHPVDEAEHGAGPEDDLGRQFGTEADLLQSEEADGGGGNAADEREEGTHGVVLVSGVRVFSADVAC